MSEQTEIRQHIRQSSLFKDISSEALDEITKIARFRVVEANTVVHGSGDALSGCSIICSGSVRVSTKGKEGVRYELANLGPGESFGELALLTEGPAASAVETQEKATLVFIPRDGIAPILSRYPDVIQAVGKRLSQVLYGVGPVLENAVERKIFTPRLSVVDFVIILGLSVFFALGFNQANQKGISLIPKFELDKAVSLITPSKAFDAYKTGQVRFVDAMPSGFFEKEHIPGAENLPLTMFDFMYDLTLAQEPKDKKIIVYGNTISRRYDGEVANKLVIRGHQDVEILEGSLAAWKNRGYPVEP